MKPLALFPVATLVAAIGWSSDLSARVPPPLTWFLYSDIVVRATVDSVETRFVPAKDFYAGMPGFADGASARICRASLHVEEVLKGSYSKPELDVVAGELDGLSDFIKAGDEVIIATNFSKSMGGNYVFPGTSGCLVRIGSTWMTDGIPHEDAEVRRAIDSMRPENLARSADIVVTGVVDSLVQHVWRSSNGGSALFEDITLRVQDAKKGARVPPVLKIRSIQKGSYWPDWRTEVPRSTMVGDRLYLFLKQNGSVYNVVGGVNGCLKVAEHALVYSDDVTLDYSDKELDRRIKQRKR